MMNHYRRSDKGDCGRVVYLFEAKQPGYSEVAGLFFSTASATGLSFVSGRLHGADNLVVTGAPAEVAGEVKADVLFRRSRVFVQQRFGLHDEPRRANSALQCRPLQKGVLNFVQVRATGNALNRANLSPFRFHG